MRFGTPSWAGCRADNRLPFLSFRFLWIRRMPLRRHRFVRLAAGIRRAGVEGWIYFRANFVAHQQKERDPEMKLMFVIPCYNEEPVLHETAKRFTAKMQSLTERGLCSADSRVLLVDDGSADRTWEIITALHKQNPLFEGLKLSRNYGHQNALFAGLMTARGRCDACITMDADLQDDMDAIDLMIHEYQDGCDVVYGVKNKRDADSPFKRGTAKFFYKLMKGLGVDITYNHADFRLMSRRALDGLKSFREVNLFLRGLAPLVGYQKGYVYYDIRERFAGESKYPLKKMIAFAINGITSFSVKPLRLITGTGIVVFLISLVMFCYTLIVWLLGKSVTGWTSIQASNWLLGGIQLLSLGIIGEYIGKIYSETKHRPRFIIDRYLNGENARPVVDE